MKIQETLNNASMNSQNLNYTQAISTSTRLRPARLASYNALSARLRKPGLSFAGTLLSQAE